MKRKYTLIILAGALALLCVYWQPVLSAATVKALQSGHGIHIDIPVKFEKANVVFNMDHLAFTGDMPIGINYMHLLANRMKEMGAKGRVIGIFHGAAAYMTLNDKAYNAYRKITTGNPYKGLIAELLRQGVQVEECAVSMRSHNWANKDLQPGVKVNSGAVARLIQLVQEGYVQIQP